MWNWVWVIGAFAVCIAMLVVAQRMEPHWVAKDDQRFLTTSDLVGRDGHAIASRREVRGVIASDGTITLSTRRFMRTRKSEWRLRSKSPTTDRGRALYLLDPIPPDPAGDTMILRVPTSSRLGPMFDALIERQR